MAEVRLSGLTKRFGDTLAVDEVSMNIPNGAFVTLLGPTGAGKTTILRLIAGLEQPDAGDVVIAGRSVVGDTPAQRNVAMVFQQYSLYPHMSVRENLAFPLRSPLLKTPADEIDRKVAEVAEVLRISHKLANKATNLSGGEMQRVSIGRALVRDPSIYLMDEPLSSLDARLRSDLRIELKRIQESLGATLLYVTHDQIEAMTMATHVRVLDHGRPGAIRVAARDLREPGQSLCRRASRPATHQRAAGRSFCRCAERCQDHRPAPGAYRARRGQGLGSSPGRTSG